MSTYDFDDHDQAADDQAADVVRLLRDVGRRARDADTDPVPPFDPEWFEALSMLRGIDPCDWTSARAPVRQGRRCCRH